MPDEGVWVGVDVGGTKVLAGAVDECGVVTATWMSAAPRCWPARSTNAGW